MVKRPHTPIERSKQRLVKLLQREPGFIGAGISTAEPGQYEILVMVADAASPVLTKIPSEWEGISVHTKIVGIPKKL